MHTKSATHYADCTCNRTEMMSDVDKCWTRMRRCACTLWFGAIRLLWNVSVPKSLTNEIQVSVNKWATWTAMTSRMSMIFTVWPSIKCILCKKKKFNATLRSHAWFKNDIFHTLAANVLSISFNGNIKASIIPACRSVLLHLLLCTWFRMLDFQGSVVVLWFVMMATEIERQEPIQRKQNSGNKMKINIGSVFLLPTHLNANYNSAHLRTHINTSTLTSEL